MAFVGGSRVCPPPRALVTALQGRTVTLPIDSGSTSTVPQVFCYGA